MNECIKKIKEYGVQINGGTSTAYINTIDDKDQLEYPGDLEIEAKIEDIIRWNAMAMVVSQSCARWTRRSHFIIYMFDSLK